jgi:hypothetical protein
VNTAQYIKELVESFSSGNIWYQGGRPQEGAHVGMYITQDRAYAEKYARQHHNGIVRAFTLSPHAKIYPKPFWWEEYNAIWGKEQMFHDYDAVRVIEPSWHKDKDDESLVLLNPHIVHQINL